jgi:hypothetical protein
MRFVWVVYTNRRGLITVPNACGLAVASAIARRTAKPQAPMTQLFQGNLVAPRQLSRRRSLAARRDVLATLPASHRQRLIKSGVVRDSPLDALFALLEIQRRQQIVEWNPTTPVSRRFVPLPFLKLLCFKGDVVVVRN